MTNISREAARRLIVEKWQPAIDAAASVGQPDRFVLPNWDRLRNYELERELADIFGGEWVIAELCPFNGEFCAWGQSR